MKITQASLPYPVLGIEGDYKVIDPSAIISIDEESDDKYHKIIYSFKDLIIPDQILNLISSEVAAFSLEIDCGATFIRKAIPFTKDSAISILKKNEIIKISLDKRNYSGEVSITPYISAIKPLTLYQNKLFNEDYGNLSFQLEPGDVLAVLPIAFINTSLDWKHQFANMGAPVVILENKDKNASIHTVLTKGEIQVMLPSKEFKIFKENLETNSNLSSLMIMSLGRPAIMTALESLKNDPRNNSAWAEALKFKISSDENLKIFNPDESNWNINELAGWDGRIEEIASLILKGEESKMFKVLKSISNSDD